MTLERLTAEQFVTTRFEKLDSLRWSELHAGRPAEFEPPDQGHGATVLNVSKVFGDFVQRTPDAGDVTFDLGLVPCRDPDTLLYPTLCWFPGATRFAHADDDFSDVPPALVVDVASTRCRRACLTDRVLALLEWGVEEVWTLDPDDGTVGRHASGHAVRETRGGETFRGEVAGCSIQVSVASLFAEPSWWTG